MNEIIATTAKISYSGGGIEAGFVLLIILSIILLALFIAALISIVSISKSMKNLVELEYKKYEKSVELQPPLHNDSSPPERGF